MPAYSIISERPIDGFDLFGKGEAVALASDLLDQLAEDAGVRPLMDFFSMDPAEVASLFDGLNLEPDPEGTGAIEPDAEIPRRADHHPRLDPGRPGPTHPRSPRPLRPDPRGDPREPPGVRDCLDSPRSRRGPVALDG